MIPYRNTWIQGVEVPAIYEGFSDTQKGRQVLSMVRNSDLIVLVLDGSKDLLEQIELIEVELEKANIKLVKKGKRYEDFIMHLPGLLVCVKEDGKFKHRLDFIIFNEVKKEKLVKILWKHLGKIAVQTKTKGKGIAEKPIIFDEGAVVEDVVEKVHKEFLKKFKYAKIWGPSAAFPGQTCGLDHKLKDTDIVEIFLK
jgi:ribosome-interacting GTPase 1